MARTVGSWLVLGCCAALVCVSVSAASGARADRVYLAGGSVIEGKVAREGDKIVIALDSGTVRLDAASVVRIEKSQTPAERIAARRAALAKDDVPGRLSLANSCRDDHLTQCERELLYEIVALAPDHAEARARLGYVRGEHGWLSRDEQKRALAARQAPSAEQAAAVRKAELERDAAELTRQQAQLSVEAQRLALRTAEAQARADAQRETSSANSIGVPYYYYGYAGARPIRPPLPPVVMPPIATPPLATPLPAPDLGINGVRHPASYFP